MESRALFCSLVDTKAIERSVMQSINLRATLCGKMLFVRRKETLRRAVDDELADWVVSLASNRFCARADARRMDPKTPRMQLKEYGDRRWSSDALGVAGIVEFAGLDELFCRGPGLV
jgi:hypothetical protein